MADITKCNDNHCPSRMKCLRYTIADSFIQSYHNFDRDEDAQNCNMFKCNKKYDVNKKRDVYS